MKGEQAFVDYIHFHVKAGDGGNGCVGFRREKYVPRGGPNGGDGGRGGHVVFEADPKLATLLDLRYRPHIHAKRGTDGMGNKMSGPAGKDVIVHVPLGTTVSDEDGRQLADLTEAGQRWIAAKGGRGGKGNQHFATATNKTPRYAEKGRPGQERSLILELKLIADAGFVGLPNAGKSTLLSKITAANPKIAPYPFTTLSPNLGVIEYDDLEHLTLADIPGLIEGASRGVGLGDRFLRHIERTRVLIHLVGDEQGVCMPDDMLYRYDLVRQELAAYSDVLLEKPEYVLINKIDLADEEFIEATQEAFRKRGIETTTISALAGDGLEELKGLLRKWVAQAPPIEHFEKEELVEDEEEAADFTGDEEEIVEYLELEAGEEE
ncbi:MAG: GTPase ObgE [Candidatus Sumerlaeota bacterium]